MRFSEIAEILRKSGYTEKEPIEKLRVFYEFGTMDFLTSDVAKKFEVKYDDGKVEEVTMVQYWFGTTNIKTIKTIEELRENV